MAVHIDSLSAITLTGNVSRSKPVKKKGVVFFKIRSIKQITIDLESFEVSEFEVETFKEQERLLLTFS